MATTSRYFLKLCLLLMLERSKCEFYGEEMVQQLDEMLVGMKNYRYTKEIDEMSQIWQEYEFGTGVGNREELIVANISMNDKGGLPKDIKNWQFLPGNGLGYLAGCTDTVFSLFVFRYQNGGAQERVVVKDVGNILTFKLISLIGEYVVVILCIETEYGTDLQWLQLSNNTFQSFWSWPLNKRVEQIEFFQHNGQNRLVLLNEAKIYFDRVFSSLDVYGYNVTGKFSDFWLCHRSWIPKTYSFQIYSIDQKPVLVLQGENSILLYNYIGGATREGLLTLSQNISTNGFRNAICFESGYMNYLAISGPQPALYKFLDNEFLYDVSTEKLFDDIGEISWIHHLPVDTYRDECLLLIQLRNWTVIGLTWHGLDFKMTSLPETDLVNFELSQATLIPKFGFVFEDKLVRIQTKLRELPRPVHDEMDEILRLKNSLKEIFQKQELILDETETLIDKSIYTNPEVTGFWNFAEVQSENLTITQSVVSNSVTVGSKNITEEDMHSDLEILSEGMMKIEGQVNDILSIWKNSVPVDSPEVHLEQSIEINGDLDIRGTLYVTNLTFDFMNGVSVKDIVEDFANYKHQSLIKGNKTFPSIECGTLVVKNINGVPVKNIVFDETRRNYENTDFSKLNQLVVNGNLNFSRFNGIVWNDLMRSIVWKNRLQLIGGHTVVQGEIVSDAVKIDNLNQLRYPFDYILQNSTKSAKVTGKKSFEKLTVANLLGIKNLNGVPIEDFVTLDSHQTLRKEITFENLIVEESLQIDGNVTGVDVNQEQDHTLLDSNVIKCDTIFSNLHVTGKLIIENSVNGKKWSDFDDILLRSDDNVEITGKKTFLGDVNVETKFNIMSGKINGHLIQDFVTVDGDQDFPFLQRIAANVSFDVLEHKNARIFDEILQKTADDNANSKCLRKRIIFNVSPILEELSFNTINSISGEEFGAKLNKTLREVNFENVQTEELLANEIIPYTVNNVSFSDFENRRISVTRPQTLTGDFVIQNLMSSTLTTQTINGLPLPKYEDLKKDFDGLIDKILSGKIAVNNLNVTGNVEAAVINGEQFNEICTNSEAPNLLFQNALHIENLELHGLINGVNFTDLVSDSVLKSDERILVTGLKSFDSLTCQTLDVPIINGHPVETIVNPQKHQNLTGPIMVEGEAKVISFFQSDGKLNDVLFDDLVRRSKYLGDDWYELNGNFRFVNNISVNSLRVEGPIQGIEFDSFLETVIFKDDNVVVSGCKTFQNNVTFKGDVTISESFNGVNLKEFYEKAVFLNENVEIDAEIVFEDDIVVEGDLKVNQRLEVGTVMDVDVNELKENAVFLNKPENISGCITFTNATFESQLTVENLNDINMKHLIPLQTEQTINEHLTLGNLTVEELEINGLINGYRLMDIFNNTFMVTGDQEITGNIKFHGNVLMNKNFDASFINGIDTSELISLDADGILKGNFSFEQPLNLSKNLRILGKLNGIDPIAWEAIAIYDGFPKKQIVSGNWIVHGDVHFKKDVLGSSFLNNVDVRKLADDMEKTDLGTDLLIRNAETDLESICQDLVAVQKIAKNQIYKFKFFDYLQAMAFEESILSVHHFEIDNLDYLMINFETCKLDTLLFNGTEFLTVARVVDFGLIENWTTLEYNNYVYFLTVGKVGCGRNSGNLWKLDNGKLMFILDLGNITDVKKIGGDSFLVLSDKGLDKWSIQEIHQRSFRNQKSYPSGGGRVKFISSSERILITDEHSIYEYDFPHMNRTTSENYFGNGEILSFRAGIFEKKMFLHYDEKISENDIFIYNGDLKDKRIRQTIRTRKPKSFSILNFDGLTETLLIFIENDTNLQIYEYLGIEGFVHRASIKMKADKMFGFKLKKYAKLSKTNCIAVINKKQLSILEAKMDGEKLDMENVKCKN